jgi:hypothetical protein
MGLLDEADDQDEGNEIFHEIEGCHFAIHLRECPCINDRRRINVQRTAVFIQFF